MTSREALDELEWFINCVYDSVEDGHAAYLKDEVESASNAYNKLEKDLEVLNQLEILKNYYPPFKEFLEEMFKNGYNDDLTKIKEWLENG